MLDSEKICLKRIKKVTSRSIFRTSTNAILLANVVPMFGIDTRHERLLTWARFSGAAVPKEIRLSQFVWILSADTYSS